MEGSKNRNPPKGGPENGSLNSGPPPPLEGGYPGGPKKVPPPRKPQKVPFLGFPLSLSIPPLNYLRAVASNFQLLGVQSKSWHRGGEGGSGPLGGSRGSGGSRGGVGTHRVPGPRGPPGGSGTPGGFREGGGGDTEGSRFRSSKPPPGSQEGSGIGGGGRTLYLLSLIGVVCARKFMGVEPGQKTAFLVKTPLKMGNFR